ncbi:AAA family ATPase [Bacillus haynesii]|uniref:AAA family ATPase n=1 Tax=Bacillus haynesii TaxID=1925021 RepID=UPI00227EFFD1|nr:AAA family ATPase [Bacillus haynesii]MCY9215812.1 AAA family ATPase [Bacillus haynesii]MCY9288131.1 AAA family ATPase [Bacillus haynesii]
MKIEMKNLGQIKNAFLEEKDLTVIVGDNGSGKTLLLEAKTFILNFYSKNVNEFIGDLNRKYSDHLGFETDWESVRKFINDNVLSISRDERPNYKFVLKIKLENDIRENINNDIKTYFEKLKQQTINELNREILMVDESNFDFNLFTNPVISPLDSIECNLTLLDEHISFLEMTSDESEHFHVLFPIVNDSHSRELILNDSTDPEILKEKKEFYDPLNNMKNRLKRLFIGGFFRDITHSGDTLYLPSERNLFMDDALTKTLKESYDSRYSFARNNSKIRFSEFLFNMAYLNYKDRLNRLEGLGHKPNPALEKMFGGKIIFDEEGDIKSIQKNDGTTIKRELFSTKQNRMIPYLILNTPFQHYSKLIIEEPEAHLSLKSIRELLGYFKRLIKNNIKVTITTHSDVFFNHLNNFILKDKDLDTKVYELKFNGNQSFLEEKNKTELGYEIDFFTEELNNLYEDTLSVQENSEQIEE